MHFDYTVHADLQLRTDNCLEYSQQIQKQITLCTLNTRYVLSMKLWRIKDHYVPAYVCKHLFFFYS